MGPRQAALPGPVRGLCHLDRSRATSGSRSRRAADRSSRCSISACGPTLLLFGLGEIIAIILGLALGAYSGWKRGGIVDHVGNGISLVLYATPYFLLGHGPADPVRDRRWAGSRRSACRRPARDYADIFEHLGDIGARTSPCRWRRSSLGLVGQYAILMRSSILDTMTEDYVTTARAKGLPEGRDPPAPRAPERPAPDRLPGRHQPRLRRRRRDHGRGRLQLAGLGTLTVEALSARDYPVLQGDLPAAQRLGRRSPTSSPTSSTASSTRGSGRDRASRCRWRSTLRRGAAGAVPACSRAPRGGGAASSAS